MCQSERTSRWVVEYMDRRWFKGNSRPLRNGNEKLKPDSAVKPSLMLSWKSRTCSEGRSLQPWLARTRSSGRSGGSQDRRRCVSGWVGWSGRDSSPFLLREVGRGLRRKTAKRKTQSGRVRSPPSRFFEKSFRENPSSWVVHVGRFYGSVAESSDQTSWRWYQAAPCLPTR